MISTERQKNIKELAESIYYKYNNLDYPLFPFDKYIEDVEDLDIKYVEGLPSDVSGAIRKEKEKYVIYINATKSASRQNFTIGHEIGHYCLHKDTLQNKGSIIDRDSIMYRIDNPMIYDSIEVEANKFSANLLMPEREVRFYFNLLKGDVEKMKELFNVSILAMSIRLIDLGLISE